MRFNLRSLLPQNPHTYAGMRLIRPLTLLVFLPVVVRSCIHLFSADGGAQSIAGIDISVAGGSNIVALFHQWGAIQLILAVLLLVIFFRYPGFTPLVLLTLLADPVMREVAGSIAPVTAAGTPPGAALNAPSFVVVSVLLLLSLLERSPKINSSAT
jgi:hypothetical protein